MTYSALLTHKHAVIFGAGGAIGQAMAKECAAQGAAVFLSGRRLAEISQVAAKICQDGGVASAAEVDALDEQAVQAYLDGVAKEAGSIDILLNVMGPQAKDYGEGTSTLELPLEQFLVPLSTMLPSQFITARAAARHMVRQQEGVILFVTAVPSRGAPNSTAIGTAFGAMESLLRCLAADLGPAESGWLAFVLGVWWILEPSRRRLRMSHTPRGSRKRKSWPDLNRQRCSGASRGLPIRPGWQLFSPWMGREPSRVRL